MQKNKLIIANMLSISKEVLIMMHSIEKLRDVKFALRKTVPETQERIEISIEDIRVQIKMKKRMIASLFKQLRDYDKDNHIVIEYISKQDIENGYCDCGIDENQHKLIINSGDIYIIKSC